MTQTEIEAATPITSKGLTRISHDAAAIQSSE
jgi:hypothetical protein